MSGQLKNNYFANLSSFRQVIGRRCRSVFCDRDDWILLLLSGGRHLPGVHLGPLCLYLANVSETVQNLV